MSKSSYKIAVLGLGNVGLVLATCLASEGHSVLGIEISDEKIENLKNSNLYIQEPKLDELFKKSKSNFTYSTSMLDTVDSDIFFVCVGTPKKISGDVNLDQVRSVASQIAKVLKDSSSKKKIYFRSTMPPGTIRNELIPILVNESGRTLNEDFEVFFYPEFLREGDAVEDYENPSLTVLGTIDGKGSESDHDFLKLDKVIEFSNFEEAEMIKYLNNSFHALKVAFANEVATIASSYDVDSEKLFNLFTSDSKLNISSKYLRPGFAYGGPCLTKDLSALNFLSLKQNIKTPLLESISQSNDKHIDRFISLIEKSKAERILFYGLSFKKNTDDLRESKILDIVEALRKRPSYQNRELFAYERKDVVSKVTHLFDKCFSNADDFLCSMDLIVLGPWFNKEDLSRIPKDTKILNLENYDYEELKNFSCLRVV